MRTWLEPGEQAEYHHLCASILTLARAATSRLLGRDADTAVSVTRPRASESRFTDRAADLRNAWVAAEQLVPGGGPLGRLGHLLRSSASFVEPVLLALAAAPLLDRTIARSYARLDPGPLTAGLLLDLASATETSRIALFGALHPDAPLRRNGLLLTGDCAAASTATPLTVAPSALAVLRCEPVPLPHGVDELPPLPDPGEALRLLDALDIPVLRSGELTLLHDSARASSSNGAPAPPSPLAPTTHTLARLLASADSAHLWQLSLDDHPEPEWLAVLRDATLANAICLVTSSSGGSWLRRLRWITDRTQRAAICVAPIDPAFPGVSAVDLAAILSRGPLTPLLDTTR